MKKVEGMEVDTQKFRVQMTVLLEPEKIVAQCPQN